MMMMNHDDDRHQSMHDPSWSLMIHHLCPKCAKIKHKTKKNTFSSSVVLPWFVSFYMRSTTQNPTIRNTKDPRGRSGGRSVGTPRTKRLLSIKNGPKRSSQKGTWKRWWLISSCWCAIQNPAPNSTPLFITCLLFVGIWKLRWTNGSNQCKYRKHLA